MQHVMLIHILCPIFPTKKKKNRIYISVLMDSDFEYQFVMVCDSL